MARRLDMEPGALFEYEEWLQAAKHGETLIYWLGNLTTERNIELDPEDRRLDALRKRLGALEVTSARIFADAKRGAVVLTQRRLDEGVYEYRATRLREQRDPVDPLKSRGKHGVLVDA